MKSYTCFFGSGRFKAMARALGESLKANAPEVDATIEYTETPARKDSFGSNTAKLHRWVEAVNALDDGEQLVLLDGDTLVLHSLAPAFDLFDTPVAMTKKAPHVSRMQYNCGVVFVRGGEAARAFFARWAEVNDRLFADRQAHIPYEVRHGGMNQAAWGMMRETEDPLCAAVSNLPCGIWNACYPPLWHEALKVGAHIVHYKSDLRAAIWGNGSRYLDLVTLWRHYESASRPQLEITP